MINRIIDENTIFEFKQSDLFSIRIKALLKAYGTGYDFAQFYAQYIDDSLTAIISRLDNDFTISFNSNADITELWEFISMQGFSSLLCSDSFDINSEFEQGKIMVTDTKCEIIMPYSEIDEFPRLMDLFNLNDYSSADFESWYVDISHRVRHNTAKAYTLNVNDEIISSGIFSSIYDDNAILSSVQTAPEFRKMGYGSALVSAMICDIRGRVWLMREENKNEEFYKKLGFINTGNWRMYK